MLQRQGRQRAFSSRLPRIMGSPFIVSLRRAALVAPPAAHAGNVTGLRSLARATPPQLITNIARVVEEREDTVYVVGENEYQRARAEGKEVEARLGYPKEDVTAL
jgi:hypothetical protein